MGFLPSHNLIHYRDRVNSADLATTAAAIGIKSLRTPVQAPNPSSVGERVVRRLRRECMGGIPWFRRGSGTFYLV